MNQSAGIGIDLSGKRNSCSVSQSFLCRKFDFAIVDCYDIKKCIDTLKKKRSRQVPVYVSIDFKGVYVYDGKGKSPLAAFTMMYDFADAFIATRYGYDIKESLDPLVNQRLYNDSYKPIYINVDKSLAADELDDIAEYAMLSDINGLIVATTRHLAEAEEKCKGIVELLYNGVASIDDVTPLLPYEVAGMAIHAQSNLFKTNKLRKALSEFIHSPL